MLVMDVNRVLDREAVGRSFAEQHHIGVAHDFAATGTALSLWPPGGLA